MKLKYGSQRVRQVGEVFIHTVPYRNVGATTFVTHLSCFVASGNDSHSRFGVRKRTPTDGRNDGPTLPFRRLPSLRTKAGRGLSSPLCVCCWVHPSTQHFLVNYYHTDSIHPNLPIHRHRHHHHSSPSSACQDKRECVVYYSFFSQVH